MTGYHNMYTLFYGLFRQSLFYSYGKTGVNFVCQNATVWLFCVYYRHDDQTFLQPQLLPCSQNTLLFLMPNDQLLFFRLIAYLTANTVYCKNEILDLTTLPRQPGCFPFTHSITWRHYEELTNRYFDDKSGLSILG